MEKLKEKKMKKKRWMQTTIDDLDAPIGLL
jgi:hypothetical protein